jgi:hypothetical protein
MKIVGNVTMSCGKSLPPPRGQSPEHWREQLARRHMVALAGTFGGWALDRRMTPKQSAQLVGWAQSLRNLAQECGPQWNPPLPEQLTPFGFLGRYALGEETRRRKT